MVGKPRLTITAYTVAIILALPALYVLDVVLENGLVEFVPLIAVYSLVMAPIGYFLKKKLDETTERTRASKNLHTELDDALNALDDNAPGRLQTIAFDDKD